MAARAHRRRAARSTKRARSRRKRTALRGMFDSVSGVGSALGARAIGRGCSTASQFRVPGGSISYTRKGYCVPRSTKKKRAAALRNLVKARKARRGGRRRGLRGLLSGVGSYPGARRSTLGHPIIGSVKTVLSMQGVSLAGGAVVGRGAACAVDELTNLIPGLGNLPPMVKGILSDVLTGIVLLEAGRMTGMGGGNLESGALAGALSHTVGKTAEEQIKSLITGFTKPASAPPAVPTNTQGMFDSVNGMGQLRLPAAPEGVTGLRVPAQEFSKQGADFFSGVASLF